MKNTLELAAHGPVIPVIVIDRVGDAVPLALRWWPVACACSR